MGWFFGVFLAGMVAGLNLASMYPSNHYEAAWWKVSAAVLVAIGFTITAYDSRRARSVRDFKRRWM